VQVLAIVKDRVPGVASETVCGGHSRQRHVMLSESHDIDVRMVLQSRRDEPGRYILIRYEGLTNSHIYLDSNDLCFWMLWCLYDSKLCYATWFNKPAIYSL